jgi:hypothetical protein
MAGDPNYANAFLLIPCDAAHGFTDKSRRPRPIGVYGNATVSSGKGVFDGSGDYLIVEEYDSRDEVDDSDCNFQFRINTITGLQYACPFSRNSGEVYSISQPGSVDFLINAPSSGYVQLWVRDYSASVPLLSDNTVSVADGSDHLIEVDRNGSTWRLFIDGALKHTTTWAGAILPWPFRWHVARDPGFSRDFNGKIWDIRCYKRSIHTSAYTDAGPLPYYAGQLTGNIDEGLATAISKWRIAATRCSDAALAGTTIATGSTYTVDCNTLEPCIIHFAPHIDYAWSANRVCAEGDLMIPPTAESDQKIYVCTAVTGDAQTGASAPTWTTGTIGDNNVTWAYVDQFRNWPVAIGPKFPA